MPAVPIEVEDEQITEDVTIEFPSVNFIDLPPLPEGFGMTGESVTMGPRLVKEVIPAISEAAKRRGARGTVRLSVLVEESGRVADVRVVDNSTIVELFRAANRGRDRDAERLARAMSALRQVVPSTLSATEVFARHGDRVAAILREHQIAALDQAQAAIRDGWDLSRAVEAAAVDAMYECQYLPARRGDKPVAVWAERTLSVDYSR